MFFFRARFIRFVPENAVTLRFAVYALLCINFAVHVPLARAESLPRLTVYTEQSAVVRDAKGAPSGFLVELMREMLRRAHVAGKVEVVPWKRAYQVALEKPNVLLFPTSFLRDREDRFHWLAPIFKVRWVLFKKRGSPLAIESLDDARRVERIAVYRGDARHQFLARQGFANLEVVSNPCLGRNMLVSGRVDLLVGSDLPPEQTGFAEQAALAGELETALELRTIKLYPVLSKGTDSAVVEACAKALESMLSDGTYAELYRTWYASPAYAAIPVTR
ncbi:substrate-binding periplasmic protein [Paucidesulfovibrio longus]|uniref:substrate-binding periplasmic protein n=1 Tax=Paucidesulfovibrio longus TaxID=889 RepID=UPI0003B72BB9|nr:transporter substrate-binding domain-containing protein [Paucidesulfovibrio longus]